MLEDRVCQQFRREVVSCDRLDKSAVAEQLGSEQLFRVVARNEDSALLVCKDFASDTTRQQFEDFLKQWTW